MSRIYVNFSGMKQLGLGCYTVSGKLNTAADKLQSTVRQLDWDVRSSDEIEKTTRSIAQDLKSYAEALKKYQTYLNEAQTSYAKLDSWGRQSAFDVFKEEFSKNFTIKDALKGAGYISTIYGIVDGVKKGEGWKGILENGQKIKDFLTTISKDYHRYHKIGNAVGSDTARAWWFKNAIGTKSIGRVSTAKNVTTRFFNNLSNKTSPFHQQLEKIRGNFTGKNGFASAAASWGTVIVSGVSNYRSNRDEQKESGGAMSDGRVVAETITETVVDTVLVNTAQVVVGAAISAVAGTVGAPAIAVTLVSGAVVAGVNAGVKAITGKSTTEWISDGILDIGSKALKAIGSVGKKTSGSVNKVLSSV